MDLRSFLWGVVSALVGAGLALWFLSWLSKWIVSVGDATHEDRHP